MGWVISINDDHFPLEGKEYETKEAAVMAGRELLADTTFYVGEKGNTAGVPLVSVDYILDSLTTSLADVVGIDAASEEFDASEEQQDELEQNVNKVIKEWVEKHSLQPTCFTVNSVEAIFP